MPSWIEWILNALGLVLTGLIILSPFLIWLSKLMIEKIISQEFENEREALKYQIATLLGRSAKIHDREFETLEAVWEKASIAVGSAAGVLSLFQSSPDVTWIEGDELDYRLGRAALPDYQVTEIKALKGAPRSRKLHDFLMEKNRVQANADWYDFHRFVILKGIFLKPEIEAKARELSNLISELLDESAWTAEEGGKDGMKSRRELNDRIKKEGATLRDEVRGMIADRLLGPGFEEGQ
jgi:hypothetical protein